MSKPTGGKVGRPAKPSPPTPAAIPETPRPTDPIAAIVWDMAVESAKDTPNPTKAGLYAKQLEALTREQDRADGIAKDEQRIELEAARILIDELNTKYAAECAESKAAIEGLDREFDELHEKATRLEGELAGTVAAAVKDREEYLAQCPACAAAAVTISGLQDGLDRAAALAEKCAEGQCPSSLSRQAEVDRTREPAAQWESWDKTVRGIEDDKLTEEQLAGMGSMRYNSSIGQLPEDDRKFLAANAEIIAEDDAAKAKVAAEKEHEIWLDRRSWFGPTRLKVMMGSERYEKEFGPDPPE